MDFSKIILGVLAVFYVIGMIYSQAVFSTNYVEDKGYFTYFLFGERSIAVKSLLWPLFILFEL